MKQQGILTFFCGKMGAGKTTISKNIASKTNAVYISEDEWLALHYPEQIQSFEDYIKFSTIIKPFVKSLVQKILNTGTNVVMDFPANTIVQRSWFIELSSEINCSNMLIYLKVSDNKCLAQIAKRRIEQPERAQFDTKEMFFHVNKFFQVPSNEENLNIEVIDSDI